MTFSSYLSCEPPSDTYLNQNYLLLTLYRIFMICHCLIPFLTIPRYCWLYFFLIMIDLYQLCLIVLLTYQFISITLFLNRINSIQMFKNTDGYLIESYLDMFLLPLQYYLSLTKKYPQIFLNVIHLLYYYFLNHFIIYF